MIKLDHDIIVRQLTCRHPPDPTRMCHGQISVPLCSQAPSLTPSLVFQMFSKSQMLKCSANILVRGRGLLKPPFSGGVLCVCTLWKRNSLLVTGVLKHAR